MEKREIAGVQGQVNNIEVIFKEYYGSLCYFASQFLKNEEVIEDLVQVVFIYSKLLFELYPRCSFARSIYCFIGS